MLTVAAPTEATDDVDAVVGVVADILFASVILSSFFLLASVIEVDVVVVGIRGIEEAEASQGFGLLE